MVGLVTQQAFLRWTAGQELRQALITIAISVIIADQIIAHFPRNVSAGAQKSVGGRAAFFGINEDAATEFQGYVAAARGRR